MEYRRRRALGESDYLRHGSCPFLRCFRARDQGRSGPMVFNGVWFGLEMKEQGAIGKTGHQWDSFSLSGIWDRTWALGKMVYRGHGICEKYPFDLSPPPHFPHSRRSSAQRTEHQHSLPGGHEDQDDEEHEKVKALWTRRAHGMDDSHGSRRLDPGDLSPLVSLGSARVVSEELSSASNHPDDKRLTRSRMEGFCYLCCTC